MIHLFIACVRYSYITIKEEMALRNDVNTTSISLRAQYYILEMNLFVTMVTPFEL